MSNRLLDIITEPDNTITNMKRFEQGDHVFHFSKKHGTASGKVVRMGASGHNVKVEFEPGIEGTVWVKAANCQLQSEWAKENEA
jgi:hypothetical protein